MADEHICPGTGIPPKFVTLTPSLSVGEVRERPATQKEKVEMWFIEPLKRMKSDDGFACLMLCFPLLEAVMRFELKVGDGQDLTLSDGSPALHWFARFMTIPEVEAREIWDAFRNGLLHRAMVKSSIPYTLTGDSKKRPAEFRDGTVFIYVWDLRNAVVKKLQEHHSKLWRSASCPLARIHISA